MSRFSFWGLLACCLLGVISLTATVVLSYAPPPAEERTKAEQLQQQGNFKDAYDIFRKLVLNPEDDPRLVERDLEHAVQCLRRLGRVKEIDELLEATVKTHPKNWRALNAVAWHYIHDQHYGFIIAGKFERGQHRGGGQWSNSLERDRVRALQLLNEAIPLALADENKAEVGDFFHRVAQALLYNRGFYESWRLQYLTDVKAELPDYEEGYPYFRNSSAAPVDKDGNPIYHAVPKSWADAKTDGERWRWALTQAVEFNPQKLNTVRFELAQFCQNQFGVETMQMFGQGFGGWRGGPQEDTGENTSGTYELHTLKETETIAKLASGIKRFTVPDEYNYIKIYQTILAEPATGLADQCCTALATLFENRRQYPRAAEYWQQSIEKFGDNNNWKKNRRDQIVGNWGQFEGLSTQPAGEGPTFDFRYRNAKKVKFTAQAVKVSELLDDLKAYLKSNPGMLDWEKVNLHNIGWRLVSKNEGKYIGEEVASWSVDLKPRENHFDRRETFPTTLKNAGAYMITAQIEGGNTCKLLLWVADTAIVKKVLNGKNYYFVADAVKGQPIPNANLEFFGYQQRHLGNNQYKIETTNFAEKADAEGQVTPDPRDLVKEYQWLITARDGNRFAFFGFDNAWPNNYHDAEYNQTKVFCITDRPVYRPKQQVHFKFWVRKAKYDQEDTSDYAKRTFPVEIRNPKGEVVLTKSIEADEYAGLEGTYDLPEDAMLGVYSVNLNAQENNTWIASGGNQFRVEEYKKPEFEVKVDAPKEPVMLGEKVTAKINAKYYFGSPVVNAKVKYKIMRTEANENWYPIAPWDWFYGQGYWWYAYDAPWYPGFNEWCGCRRPWPWWWYRGQQTPPELVAENEVQIGADGTIEVSFDTAVTKELHGKSDHKFTITAEVRDESRRTIVGTGEVLVARKPFKVFTWLDRGYYRVGDSVVAHFKAQTLDKKPVQGKGKLTLFKITYEKDPAKPDDLKLVEKPVRVWDVDTNEEGYVTQQLAASAGGQYRLSYKLTDSKKHEIEGGYLFTIVGEGMDGKDFRFNAIELINEKREYAPGEKVKLQINTNQADSTVLLFVRPTNGVYLPPKVIHIKGKTTIEELDITKKDMPNFFVEAVTVSGGQVYSEAKEIIVPPEKRVLNVTVTPSATEYKPGEKAKVKVQLTEMNGEPFEGQTVLSIYDKSVEYISGGSNVPDIKEFFWKWRRHHQPQTASSLQLSSQNLTRPNEIAMAYIGIYGYNVADELDSLKDGQGGLQAQTRRAEAKSEFAGRGGGFGGAGGPPAPMAAMAPGMSALRANRQMNALGDANGAPADAAKRMSDGKPGEAAVGAENPLVEPTIRSNFADTAYWNGAIKTDKTGQAEIEMTMPENLSGWKIKAWGLGHGTKVGSADVEVVTRKNLIVRLQAPRFFVQKDEVVLSANVHSYLKTDKEVTVTLEIPGGLLKSQVDLTQKVMVPAGGEKRVDWVVSVTDEGLATVRMKAQTDEESDAMEMKLPCFIHGMLKMEAWAGTIRPDKAEAAVKFTVPTARRVPQSMLEVRYSPTLAGAMVDALPYLVDYPYGCTEQTLNRFLPTVITQKVLLDMKLNLAEIKDKRSNLNAQEIGMDTERAKQWKRYDRNPVFDEAEVKRMVTDGVKMLTNMQCADGGWGWFSGFGERSWPHTTAVVVHGLQVAQKNDVALVPGMLERGIEWLKRYQAEQAQWIKNAAIKDARPAKSRADDLDAFVYMVLVDAGHVNTEMMDFLYRDRNDLSVYSKAMFGCSLHKQGGQDEKLAMIVKNCEQYLVQDAENETAYLRLPNESPWWYWYGSETEANAYYLKLLSLVEPKGEKAPRLVKYLLNNRKHATYWNSTRDTALVVEAFADYLRASGEMQPDMVVEVWLDGKKQKEAKIDATNLFTYDNKFVITGDAVTDGSHTLELKRTGKGPVYFNAYLTNFTLEDDIKKAGLEVKVNRKYYKLTPVKKEIKVVGDRGQALDQRVEKYERTLLESGAELTSGDLVEIELEIESKNDYEYILFEDMKPAGFEPVEVRSGYSRNGLGAYMELRDNRVSFFVRALARGNHSINYRMRAEIPGKFSALPAKASAMYAPELKGNSDELKLKIKD